MREYVLARNHLKQKREEEAQQEEHDTSIMTQQENDPSTVRKDTVGEGCTEVSAKATTEPDGSML